MKRIGHKDRDRCLILNADYSPLSICHWKAAVKGHFKNLANPQDPKGLILVEWYDEDYILTCGGTHYPVPAVMTSHNYTKLKPKLGFSRLNMFLRDNLTCQYCGYRDGTVKTLTIDHIVPKEYWRKLGYHPEWDTPTHWKNCVTSCKSCNSFKANRLPEEAGMELANEPIVPDSHGHVKNLRPWTPIPSKWNNYLSERYSSLFDLNGV